MINQKIDPQINDLIADELKRQKQHVELIASENYTSDAVMRVEGSCFTNKYAEGYPHHRYYNGCEVIDQSEILAQNRIKKLFACECMRIDCKNAAYHANVQPHSGSQANTAVYMGLLKPNDTILGMSLDAGGHLSHGHFANFSGKVFNSVQYHILKNGQINFTEVRELAQKHKPKLIICGASSFSLKIDFSKFRKIADEVGALLMADVAHIAGLIVAGLHPNPVHDVDVVTMTTHKTLRGPRGGVILCRSGLVKQIDKGVFPILQGGPLENIILAKAQAFYEALQPEFKIYQKQVIDNAQTMARTFQIHNCQVVGGGTDNHLLMINTKDSFNLTGKAVVNRLEKVNIIANKNMVPFDTANSMVTSGVRFGTPAMTTRGFKEHEFIKLVNIIVRVCRSDFEHFKQKIPTFKHEVQILLEPFQIYI